MAKVLKRKPKFSPEQMQIINFKDGPLLVNAVAGSGKTTTLTYRIKKLIENGVEPQSILAMTFTKKAATEMNNRLKKLGIDTNEMQVTTIHSTCYRILRREGKGIPQSNAEFEIDSSGSKEKKLIKYILGYQVMNWKKADLGEVRSYIANCKNSLIRPFEAKHPTDPRFVEAYRIFEKMREERGFITFDDMLIKCWELLENYRDILSKYQQKWKYVLIDETQDSNLAQITITEMLAAPEYNYMIVGDTSQSIYSFRGALPEYMLNFKERFPNATVIFMNKNYRCQKQMIDVVNLLLPYNKKRFDILLEDTQGDNGVIEVNKCIDSDDEAVQVKNQIKQLLEDGTEPKEIAILYRINALSRAIEDQLIHEGIPYEIVGGMNFYNRREVKDILAYVKAALENSGEHLKRIINVPFRYLGKVFLDNLETFAIRNKCSYEEALRQIPAKSNQQRSITDFLSVIDYIRENNEKSKPHELLQTIVDRIDYINFLKKEEGENEEENSRIGNVRELINAASKYSSIKEFLNYIELLQKKRKKNEEVPNKVVLSTIHRAKGLEWENVFIVGLNEDIIPHAKAKEIDFETGEIIFEEERRLCYVGITRAKKRAFLSYVLSSQGKVLSPSIFLYEMKQIKQEEFEEPKTMEIRDNSIVVTKVPKN